MNTHPDISLATTSSQPDIANETNKTNETNYWPDDWPNKWCDEWPEPPPPPLFNGDNANNASSGTSFRDLMRARRPTPINLSPDDINKRKERLYAIEELFSGPTTPEDYLILGSLRLL